eukprot:3489335-Prymnesium_polylepis.1
MGTKHVTSAVRTTFCTSIARDSRSRRDSKSPHAAPPPAARAHRVQRLLGSGGLLRSELSDERLWRRARERDEARG